MIHHKDFPFEDKEEQEIIHVSNSSLWKHHKWKILGLAFVIASLMFGGKYLYDLGRGSTNPMDAPLITATNEPFKAKPEDPGGMVIPHMDKDIFDSIDEDFTPKAENIQPIDSYEKPMAFDTENDPLANLIEKEKVDKVKPQIKPKSKTVKLDGSSNYKKPVITAGRKSKKIDIDKVLAKQKAPEYWVQLGTFSSDDAATKAWQEVSEKNEDILGDYNTKISKSDLGENGVFYRLQSGPLSSHLEATNLCQNLNKREQNCFPVKPAQVN